MSDLTMVCPRCAGALSVEQKAENVTHYVCPAPACEPPRESRWRFVLGLGYELVVMAVLLIVALLKWLVWLPVRGYRWARA